MSAPTRLFRQVQRIVGKALPAAGAAYSLNLIRQEDGGTARVDGTFPAGATSIDLRGASDTITSLAPGATFRIGANATTYTVANTVTAVDGKLAGVEFSPPLASVPVNGGSVEFAPRSATYPCKGLVTAYSDHTIASGTVRATDKRVLILGATLPAGIRPRSGDRITTPDGTATIVPDSTPGASPIKSDPAGAAFECRCT